jgi:hypothetical protein
VLSTYTCSCFPPTRNKNVHVDSLLKLNITHFEDHLCKHYVT